MKNPVLLTTRRIFDCGSLVIMEGDTEIAAVFGSPKEQELRAAELTSHANTFRMLRAHRMTLKDAEGKVQ